MIEEQEEVRRPGSPPLLFESPLFKEFYNTRNDPVPDEISLRVLESMESIYANDKKHRRKGRKGEASERVRFCTSGEVVRIRNVPTNFSLFSWKTRAETADSVSSQSSMEVEPMESFVHRISPLECEERINREELVSSSLSQLNGLYLWFMEASRNLFRREQDRMQLLNAMEEKITFKIKMREIELREKEEILKSASRRAWNEEVLLRQEQDESRRLRREWMKAERVRVSAALTFIIVTEKNERAELVKEEPVARGVLLSAEADGRAAAERAAYERWLTSPEGQKMEEERQKKERRREQARRRILMEQKRIVSECRHGRGGTSVFEGEDKKDKCFKCGFIWDEGSELYIPINVAGRRKSSATLMNIAEKKKRTASLHTVLPETKKDTGKKRSLPPTDVPRKSPSSVGLPLVEKQKTRDSSVFSSPIPA